MTPEERKAIKARIRASRAPAEQGPTPEPVAPPIEPEKINEPWYEDLAEGAAVSGMEAYYGAKELAGKLTDEDRETLDNWRKDANESGWGDVGRVGGELAMFAVPGTAGIKAGKALATAGKPLMAKAAPIVAELAAAATYGGVKLPEEGETRKGNIAQETGAMLLGQGAGKILSKAVKGIRKTPAAEELIEKGVELTPGQASAGGIPKAIEFMMSWAPGLAQGTQKAKDRAFNSWNKIALQEAAPPGKTITDIGTKGNKQLKNAYDDAYGEAWALAGRPTVEGFMGIGKTASQGIRDLGLESQRVITQVMDDVSGLLEDYAPKKLKDLDNLLRRKISSSSKGANAKPELAEILGRMRIQLRGAVDPAAQQALKAIDSQYGKYAAVRRAGSSAKAIGEGGTFTPKQLVAGVKSSGKETRAFTGDAPLQEFTAQGIKVLEDAAPRPIIDVKKGIAQQIFTPVPLKAMGKVMLGQTGPQKTAQQIMNSAMADTLRYGITPGRLGAAYEE